MSDPLSRVPSFAPLVELEKFMLHQGAIVEQRSPVTISCSAPVWSYMLSFTIDPVGAGFTEVDLPVRLVVRAREEEGHTGVLLVGADYQTVLSQAEPQPGAGGITRYTVFVTTLDTPQHLVLRKETEGDLPVRVAVHSVTEERGAHTTADIEAPPVIEPVDRDKLRAIGFARPGNSPRVVPVESLHQVLGFREALVTPPSSRTKRLQDWKMDVDDAPIVRYLYRQAQPRRHLEFGTWMGQGTVYCLEESAATVWTLNLPEGERTVEGRPAYSAAGDLSSLTDPTMLADLAHLSMRDRANVSTDAGIFIGQLYRARGFGHRVCQIYCDTRDWDTSNFPPGFFDSALIDGGHTPDVVWNDTQKALQMVRPGGLLMWHDFCPDEEMLATSPTSSGVVAGVLAHWDAIAEACDPLFWIDPSLLLVGIRRAGR